MDMLLFLGNTTRAHRLLGLTATVASYFSVFFHVSVAQDIRLVPVSNIETHSGRIKFSNPVSVFVLGSYAYVANFDGNSLDIIDISNPVNPTFKGRIVHSEDGAQLKQPTCVFVSGSYAYVTASGSNSLEVIDIENPTAPAHLGAVVHGAGGAMLKNPRAVIVLGDHAYIASKGSYALEIINIENPRVPYHRSSLVYDVGSSGPISVQISGNSAFLTNSNGLEVVDISFAGNPVHKASLSNKSGPFKLTLPEPVSMAISGGFAYMVDDFRMEVVDVTNPLTPRSAGVLNLERVADAKSINVFGDFAFITCASQNTLTVVDVSYPKNPVQVGSLAKGEGGASLDGAQGAYVLGDFAYVVSRDNNALEIINIDIKQNPSFVASLSLSKTGALLDRVNSIAITNNHAFLVNPYSESLDVIDIKNPYAPVYKNLFSDGAGGALLTGPNSIVVRGDYAFVASKTSNALEILKLTDPSNPIHVAAVGHGERGALLLQPNRVFVSDNYAYVTSLGDALEIIDITNPEFPVHTGSLQDGTGGVMMSNPTAIFVAGKYAYITSESNALEIIDVSDPGNPIHAGSIQNGQGGALLNSPQDVFVRGNHAIVTSSGSNALEIIDVSNPIAPFHVSSLADGVGGAKLNRPSVLHVSGNFAFVSSKGIWTLSGNFLVEDRSSALEVVDISDMSKPTHETSMDYPGFEGWPTSFITSGDYLLLTRRYWGLGRLEFLSLNGLVPPTQLKTSVITTNSFEATWDIVPYAQGYLVDVTTDNFSSFVGGYEDRLVNSNSIKVEGLTPDMKYQWRVRTKQDVRSSINSDTIRVWITVPKALAATDITTSSFTANWEMLENVNSYHLDVSKDNFTTFVASYENVSTFRSTSFAVTNLASAETYQYRLAAKTSAGSTGYSNVITLTTGGPSASQALPATNIQNYTFTANWTEIPGAVEYYLDLFYYDQGNSNLGAGIFSRSVGNSTSYTIPEVLIRNHTYAYRVRARTADAISTNSNLIVVKTAAVSRPPEALEALNVTESSFLANWIRIDELGSKHYLDVVYDRILGSDNFVPGNFVPGFENYAAGLFTSATVSGLPGGTRFQYRVRSEFSTYGPSVNSNVISVTTTDNVTGITEGDEALSLYPNPVFGKFLYVTFKAATAPASVLVINNLGQQMLHESLGSTAVEFKLDVSDFQGGVYIAIFQYPNGVRTQRFLINR
jgi:hypothetical protein